MDVPLALAFSVLFLTFSTTHGFLRVHQITNPTTSTGQNVHYSVTDVCTSDNHFTRAIDGLHEDETRCSRQREAMSSTDYPAETDGTVYPSAIAFCQLYPLSPLPSSLTTNSRRKA